MCLAVYLGTKFPVTPPETAQGRLGIETVSWTPAPLRRYDHVYYLATRAADGTLTCSCALSESVEWTDQGPVIHGDDDATGAGQGPFEVLRALCEEATRDARPATLVCDDGSGADQPVAQSDYDSGFVRLHHISRGNLIFADVNGGFPWRMLHVVR